MSSVALDRYSRPTFTKKMGIGEPLSNTGRPVISMTTDSMEAAGGREKEGGGGKREEDNDNGTVKRAAPGLNWMDVLEYLNPMDQEQLRQCSCYEQVSAGIKSPMLVPMRLPSPVVGRD